MKTTTSSLIDNNQPINFESVVQNSVDAFCILDHTKIVFINRRFSSLIEITEAEIAGGNIELSDLFNQDVKSRILAILKGTVKQTTFSCFVTTRKSRKEIEVAFMVSSGGNKQGENVLIRIESIADTESVYRRNELRFYILDLKKEQLNFREYTHRLFSQIQQKYKVESVKFGIWNKYQKQNIGLVQIGEDFELVDEDFEFTNYMKSSVRPAKLKFEVKVKVDEKVDDRILLLYPFAKSEQEYYFLELFIAEASFFISNEDAEFFQSILFELIELHEKQEAESFLREQQERLKLATSSADIGIWDWDIKNNVLIWDDAMYSIFGVQKNESQNTYETWSKRLHPDDRVRAEKEVEMALSGEKELNTNFRIILPSGEQRYVHGVATVTQDETGNPIRLTGSNLDITDVKRSESVVSVIAEVQRGYLQNKKIIQKGSPLLQFLCESTQSSGAFFAKLEYSSKGRKFEIKASLDSGGDETIKTLLTSATGNEGILEYFLSFFDHDSSFCFFNSGFDSKVQKEHPFPVVGSTKMMGIPLFHRDYLLGMICLLGSKSDYDASSVESIQPLLDTLVTILKSDKESGDRVNAEKKVAKYSEIIANSNDAVIGTDEEGKIEIWNKGASEMFDYTYSEIFGGSMDQLLSEHSKEEYRKLMDQVLAGGAHKNIDLTFLKKDGIAIDCNFSLFPVKNLSGKVKGVSSILRDVSDQKEVEKLRAGFRKHLEEKVTERTLELEKAKSDLATSLIKEKQLGELKSRFVATASHQFRTPLTVIQSGMGVLSMLRNDMGSDVVDQFDKVNHRIKKQIARMTELMNDVLILGKMDVGSYNVNFQLCDLDKLCQEIVQNHEEIQKDGRGIQIKIEGEQRKIMLDENMISHALSNFISNALKYSPLANSPSLLLSFQKDRIVVEIIDEGIGIPKDDLEHIFDAFYRASNTGDIEGTGLGTAIAFQYIKMNEGTVEIDSEENVGTTVRIIFNK